MIRLFTILYQLDLNQLPTTLALFHTIDKSFCMHSTHCPVCKAKGHLSMYDDYERNLIGYEDGAVQEELVAIRRVLCSSCKATSAIIPDVIVPHKSYSILFILQVLKVYFFREETVTALCSRFGIAVATLYAWKKQYLSHKTISLGKLEQYIFERDPHLLRPRAALSTDYFHRFFQRFGFSFLQKSKTTGFNSS